MKINTSAIIALAIIVIMVGSSLTAGLLQAFSFGATGNAVKKTGQSQCPITGSIIDCEPSPDVSAELEYKYGVTIIRFSCSLDCTKYLDIKNYLEELTNKYPKQLLLIELVSKSATPDLVMSSSNGDQPVYNLTKDNVFKAVCGISNIIDPECAVSKV